jgi:SAM-dependent methyltransferase
MFYAAAMSDYLTLNRAFWDELAAIHTDPERAFYKTDAFRRGANVLDWQVRRGIGDVSGKRLLHLQCHFGLDTLCLARMGAEVTGLDFSPVAIEAARALSAETGVSGRFILSDVLNAPAELTGFDIVFASWGAICWIPDLQTWMRVAARALNPGGRLYLHEGHPLLMMFDERVAADGPFRLRYPYDSPDGIEAEHQQDYASDVMPTAHRNVGWAHGLARILGATLDAGLTITSLDELDRIPWHGLPQLVKVDEDYWALPAGATSFPLAFALAAVKS